MTFDPRARMGVLAVLIGGTLFKLQADGISQPIVQRYLTLPNSRAIKHALILGITGFVIIISMCIYIGLLAFAEFYQCDPITTGVSADPFLTHTAVHSSISAGRCQGPSHTPLCAKECWRLSGTGRIICGWDFKRCSQFTFHVLKFPIRSDFVGLCGAVSEEASHGTANRLRFEGRGSVVRPDIDGQCSDCPEAGPGDATLHHSGWHSLRSAPGSLHCGHANALY